MKTQAIFRRTGLAATLLLGASLIACGGGGGGSSSSGSSSGSGSGGTAANIAPVLDVAATAVVSENRVEAIIAVSATDADSSATPSLSVAASGDSQFFELDSLTNTLRPKGSFDHEIPVDANGDNVYEVSVTATDGNGGRDTQIVSIEVLDISDDQSFGLDGAKAPSENFDLSTWKLQLPIDEDTGALSGTDSDEIRVSDLNAGYESEYFFTGADGAMVFRTPDNGATTSPNTLYTRTELREMLRGTDLSISTSGVNENNWVFSSAPAQNQTNAGGVDGIMRVTMAINSVVDQAGENFQRGRIIIGQIHGDNDEPIRLYYRKLPGNSHGSIYAAHEIFGGDDIWYEIIGSRDNDAPNPPDGILLNQLFTYEIEVNGHVLDVTIERDGAVIGSTRIDMSASGYEGDWMYFKAGLYQQGSYGANTSSIDETAQLSIYEISKSHD